MLYQLHLLVFDVQDGWRVEACGPRVWRPSVLVPRQLCVFESVPCGQVRLYEMAGFVRVQVHRLSPFRRTGCSAVRRGGRLHLWMWDADEVDGLLSGHAPAGVRRIAESVYLPWPVADGVSHVRCTQTEDAVTCRDGAMLEAGFGPILPLQLSGLARKPVGFDWGGGGADEASNAARPLDGVLAFNRLGVGVVLAVLGYLGYESGRLWGSREVAQTLETRLAEYTVAKGRRTGIEAELRADSQWLESYLQASSQLDLGILLAAIRPVLEAHGVVIRELDSAGTQLRLVLVTAGGEMRLPDLLQALRGLAGVKEVRLDQHKELGEATFVMDVPGFVRQPSLDSMVVKDSHGQH